MITINIKTMNLINAFTLKILDILLFHTEKTALGSILAYIVGYMPNIAIFTADASQRSTIIFYFQCLAYSVSIIVGLLAAIAYIFKGCCWLSDKFSKKKKER